MASERAHNLVRRFRFWQMRLTWLPMPNLRTRRGRAYGWFDSAIVWLLLRTP